MKRCDMRRIAIGVAACAVGLAAVAWAAEPSAGASLLFVQGDVVVRAVGGEWQPAQAGQPLRVGDEVRVGEGAYAELSYDRDHTSVSRLDKTGTVVIEQDDDGGVRVRLKQGRLFNIIAPLQTGQHFVVQTPEAVASVRGTVFEGDRAEATGTTFAVYDQGDPQAHEVVAQAVDAAGRPVGEERVLGEGWQTEIREGRLAEAVAVSTEKTEAARELLSEVERHAQEPSSTERAPSVPQGPPPGAPPTGGRSPMEPGSPAAGQELPRTGEAPSRLEPRDAAALSEVLGVSPEALQRMSPEEMATHIEQLGPEEKQRFDASRVLESSAGQDRLPEGSSQERLAHEEERRKQQDMLEHRTELLERQADVLQRREGIIEQRRDDLRTPQEVLPPPPAYEPSHAPTEGSTTTIAPPPSDPNTSSTYH